MCFGQNCFIQSNRLLDNASLYGALLSRYSPTFLSLLY
jgi:hypothetical protein